jgi:hypothetical protein
MPKTPKGEIKIDPRGGDAILKRMLQAKPKTHDEMVSERHKGEQKRPRPKKDAGE